MHNFWFWFISLTVEVSVRAIPLCGTANDASESRQISQYGVYIDVSFSAIASTYLNNISFWRCSCKVDDVKEQDGFKIRFRNVTLNRPGHQNCSSATFTAGGNTYVCGEELTIPNELNFIVKDDDGDVLSNFISLENLYEDGWSDLPTTIWLDIEGPVNYIIECGRQQKKHSNDEKKLPIILIAVTVSAVGAAFVLFVLSGILLYKRRKQVNGRIVHEDDTNEIEMTVPSALHQNIAEDRYQEPGLQQNGQITKDSTDLPSAVNKDTSQQDSQYATLDADDFERLNADEIQIDFTTKL